MNRLSQEKSPYLLQHAMNPVDWYPWGKEAFEKAHMLDKLIFLSIGYSSCHWCHVMEKESFSDIEVGKLLNANFINIKLDREEHPEVDSLYIDFAQVLLSGEVGWPLNIILTPDLKPLIAVTYLPPRQKDGSLGLIDFIQQVQQLWQGKEKKELLSQAHYLVEMFANTSNATGNILPSEEDLSAAVQQFLKTIDPIYGGIRGKPKFPLGFHLEFLLNWAKYKNDLHALHYIQLTLNTMARGGIYDQLGGGFYRYSTEEDWLIPHFEKMLYDNAILARCYLQAWKATRKPFYRQISQQTLDYLIRELMDQDGGFFSGEDADTEGEEGKYYLWDFKEVQQLLTPEELELFCSFYDVSMQGNFQGKSILHVDLSLEEYSQALQMPQEEVETMLNEIQQKLLAHRKKRTKPIRDEKIIVSWNGLTIDALAKAGQAFHNPHYFHAAEKTVKFIYENLWKDGRLLHRWCNQDARFPGILEDYAFLIKGLLSLAESVENPFYLKWACELSQILERDFKEIEGAFYQTNGQDLLLFRKCDFSDGAEPSGNSVHAENLLRIYQMTADSNYLQQAEDILKASRYYILNTPSAAFYHMIAVLRYLDKNAPTIILGGNDLVSKGTIQKRISDLFNPHLLAIPFEYQHFLITENKCLLNEKLTMYLCYRNKCNSPLTKLEEIIESIDKL